MTPKPRPHRVRCRDCGSPGFEVEADLMPNTCPACFEKRVAPVFARSRSLAELVAGLIEVGCDRDRITRHLDKLWAQSIGLRV